ncbi:hypothetical protein BDN71DRAFT_1445005 [Pleurotus eryngii]|uniref:Uncharacterized protein n=1 Tax=Pleurotus eryngii TaxID=5323 RepID=A0A9P6D8R6_PLEER|nr:hypothetical protein BDN71DRAFT_1445005 [Pleurotus eryngii]
MVYVRSRKFCCCLPVRFGVFVIAILGMAGGGVITVAGIMQATKTSGNKLALIIQIIIYGLLALLSIFGLIGAIGKIRGFISAYFTMLTALLAFSICSGAYSLYRLFNDKQGAIDDCIGDSDSKLQKGACEKGAGLIRGIMVGLFIVVWLIQIWGCFIVNSYSKQLWEEEDANYVRKDTEARRPQW